jgi:gag-polypeptide of LTR copia-type
MDMEPIAPQDQIFTMVAADRLEGIQNWSIWKRKVYDIMCLQNLLGHLTGAVARPALIPAIPAVAATGETPAIPAVPADDTAGKAWDQLDLITRANMTWNIVDTDEQGILDTHTAADIWALLNTKYEKTDIQSQIFLIDRLRMKKHEDSASLMDHIAELDRGRSLANHAGANITDEAYKLIIIQSLPHS